VRKSGGTAPNGADSRPTDLLACGTGATGGKTPWHKRTLPSNWTEEEAQFFSNWMKGLANLHSALSSTATDRPKLLRRARKIYLKLGYSLNQQIQRATIRPGDSAKSGCTVKGVRQ
jgi:hypothetical protein